MSVDDDRPQPPHHRADVAHEDASTTSATEAAARRLASAERRKERKAARAARPLPERDPLYEGYRVVDLRGVRTQLVEEETRVSYWRRVMQARLDIAKAGRAGGDPIADLSRVLCDARASVSRLAHIDVHPVDDLEPLPNLSELWARQVTPEDVDAVDALVCELEAAEAALSSHRADVHRRIDLVTAELIARYREHPELALQILPTDPLSR